MTGVRSAGANASVEAANSTREVTRMMTRMMTYDGLRRADDEMATSEFGKYYYVVSYYVVHRKP